MKEIKTDKMQSEKRIFGIPIVTFVIIVIALCGITFYASSYASENSKVLQKYESTQGELYSINLQLKKQGKKYKMCMNNLKQFEESNRDLKHTITKANTAKSDEEKKNAECQSQVASLHQFYLNVKQHAGILKDSDKSNVEGISNAELDQVMGTIKDLKEKQEEAMQNEKEKTRKSEELFKVKNEENEQHKHTIAELREEVVSVRKLLEEKEDEISNLVREKEKPGFLKKKPQPHQPNVKMLDMNKAEGKTQEELKPKTVAPTQTTTPLKEQPTQALSTKAPENVVISNDVKGIINATSKKDANSASNIGDQITLTTTQKTVADRKEPSEKKSEKRKEEVKTLTTTQKTVADQKEPSEKESEKRKEEVVNIGGEIGKLRKQDDESKTTEVNEDEDFDDHIEGTS